MKKPIDVIINDHGAYRVLTVAKAGQHYDISAAETASDLRIAVRRLPQGDTPTRDDSIVAGVAPLQTAVYRFDAPPVADQELGQIVAMQAETILPLPAEEMSCAWRADAIQGGARSITLLATRRQTVDQYVAALNPWPNGRIASVYEGIAHAWTVFYQPQVSDGVVVHWSADSTAVLHLVAGKLRNAATIDATVNDLAGGATSARFVQDLRNLLDAFGVEATADIFLPIADDATGAAAETLESHGLNVTSAELDAARFTGLAPEQLSELTPALGLALQELDGVPTELDFYTRRFRDRRAAPALTLPPWLVSLVAALVMLAVLLGVMYRRDVRSLEHTRAQLAAVEATIDPDALAERQRLRRYLAERRCDMIGIIEAIHPCKVNDMLIDQIVYRRDQCLKITGHTKKAPDILTFQENLQAAAAFSDVRNEGESKDEKKKATKFTLSCEYHPDRIEKKKEEPAPEEQVK